MTTLLPKLTALAQVARLMGERFLPSINHCVDLPNWEWVHHQGNTLAYLEARAMANLIRFHLLSGTYETEPDDLPAAAATFKEVIARELRIHGL